MCPDFLFLDLLGCKDGQVTKLFKRQPHEKSHVVVSSHEQIRQCYLIIAAKDLKKFVQPSGAIMELSSLNFSISAVIGSSRISPAGISSGPARNS